YRRTRLYPHRRTAPLLGNGNNPGRRKRHLEQLTPKISTVPQSHRALDFARSAMTCVVREPSMTDESLRNSPVLAPRGRPFARGNPGKETGHQKSRDSADRKAIVERHQAHPFYGKDTRQPLDGADVRALRALYRERQSDEWVFMSERGP